MKMIKRLIKNWTVRLCFAVLLVGVVASVALIFANPWIPYKITEKLGKRLSTDVYKAGIETILLRTSVGQVSVPPRPGKGGGLGTLGHNLVLLTFDGVLYEVGGGEARKLEIGLPDSGLEAFLAMAQSERYSAYNFKPINQTQPRFSDIDFYSGEDHAGIVVTYTEWRPKLQCYNTAVAVLEIPLDLEDISGLTAESGDWSVIFRTEPCLPLKKQNKAIETQMAGSRLAVIDSRTIFLTSGDYHWDSTHHPETLADKADNHYGKVLKIDLHSGQVEIVAKGLRNPQGISYDAKGRLWTLEHGPRGGDELNLVKAGGNYGWPLETLGTAPAMTPWPLANDYGRHDQSLAPVYAWLPSVGASNLTVVSGFHPAWDGDLLAASLKAQSLFRIRLHEDRVVYAESIRIEERIRYVHQHSDGQLYLWTDSDKVLVLYSPETYAPIAKLKAHLARMSLEDPALERQVLEAIQGCMGCHSLEGSVEHSTAPSLAGLYGRRIGAGNYRYYSQGFLYRTKTWNEERLKEFLRKPDDFIPGARMPDPGIESEKVLNTLASLIKEY